MGCINPQQTLHHRESLMRSTGIRSTLTARIDMTRHNARRAKKGVTRNRQKAHKWDSKYAPINE